MGINSQLLARLASAGHASRFSGGPSISPCPLTNALRGLEAPELEALEAVVAENTDERGPFNPARYSPFDPPPAARRLLESFVGLKPPLEDLDSSAWAHRVIVCTIRSCDAEVFALLKSAIETERARRVPG